MDPLSVLASIVGLLAVSGKVSKGLGGVISSLKDAPNSVHIVLTEVNGFHAVISSIHKFVQSNVLVSSRRAALIDVDQLIVTLTESVLTFSEFDTVVTSLKAASTTQYGLRNRMRYAWKEDKIARLIGRVQQHKASLALILNIIQCESDVDAARSQDELRGLVEQLLERNQDIVRRLMQLEDTYGARSRVTRQPSGEDEDDDDTATIRSANNSMATTSSSTLIDPIQFSFQADLEASRVYRRLRGNECDCSFTSSIARSHAWSVFSGLSLGEISIVSIIALPLYPADISNAEGYTFGDIWSHFGPSKEPRSALDPESLALLLEPKKNEDPVPSFKASGPLAKNSTPQADLSGANEGEDIIYPCSGCGDILQEGKAFELAGRRWHLDCFRCNTCSTLLDSDANLLLLRDGSLICNKCTYDCSACGNKIEDLAILTGDQAFCKTCFKCRNCQRVIENLRYARTSQGIFCMSCHDALMARRRKKNKVKLPPPPPDDRPPLPALPSSPQESSIRFSFQEESLLSPTVQSDSIS